jgi:pseudouridine synthase
MRLIRYLATASVASRRKSEAVIRGGQVEVNGETERNPFRILSAVDSVAVNGETISIPSERTVLLLHKPAGVITTVSDTHGRKTVMDLIPATDRRLFPVGRLDKETTGILLLTDDGDLAYRLTHPKFEVDKIYEAAIDRRLTEAEKLSIASGINIGEGEIGHAEVVGQQTGSGNVKITLKLHHGKKREVRRILKAVGVRVRQLHRSVFAGISLGNLKAGEFRFLTGNESPFLDRILNHAPSSPHG